MSSPETEKWHIPQRYRVTSRDAEKIAKAEAEQKKLASRINSPFATLNPQEYALARAAQQIPELEQALSDYQQEIHKRSIRGGDVSGYEEAKAEACRELSELYATTGRYDLAATFAPDTEHASEYEAIWAAVWRDDDEWCDCPPIKGQGEHSSISVPRYFVKQDVRSMKDGAWRALVKCATCPAMNVKPIPPDLALQRSHRQRAFQLAGHLSPEDAKQILIANKHTTAQLLK